jgi:hypothetical protein
MMVTPIRPWSLVLALLLAVVLVPVAAARGGNNIVVATPKAPVVADGDVAGRPTEFNLVLDRSLDPQVAGRTLLTGKTISVTLPDAFVRTAVPVQAPESGALVKGWPQGGLDGYTVTLAGTHTVVFTATRDIVPSGPDDPGIKVLHVRGRAFTNPAPGDYAITVVAETGPDGAVETGTGTLTIRPRTVPSVNPSNALFPQPSNNNWQRVPVDTVTPLPLDFLLFGADGQPLNGVGVAPADPARFPRYTGGLLVRDTNGDGLLDPATDTVVGGIIGAAPAAATGQRAASPVDAAGRPVLSGQIARPDGITAPGILRILFRSGDRPGEYAPTFELGGGTATRLTIVATAASTPAMPGLPNTGGGAAAGAVQSQSAWWLTSLLGAAALALTLATIKRRLDR